MAVPNVEGERLALTKLPRGQGTQAKRSRQGASHIVPPTNQSRQVSYCRVLCLSRWLLSRLSDRPSLYLV